jgi:hypothetical protein
MSVFVGPKPRESRQELLEPQDSRQELLEQRRALNKQLSTGRNNAIRETVARGRTTMAGLADRARSASREAAKALGRARSRSADRAKAAMSAVSNAVSNAGHKATASVRHAVDNYKVDKAIETEERDKMRKAYRERSASPTHEHGEGSGSGSDEDE